ncbi:MAG: hypothetical protein NZ988_04730 [Thaumarchaeota archaeon]|nr:hypothetical protein [Candidatus Calditenuaceae archaeon]MDW8187333.1 hypothetical protein [Nitrososphaerota archaeon]
MRQRVRLTCALIDRPGTLLRVLEQIALAGGNIISIVHNREIITSGYVPVSINVEFPDLQSLERARKGIEGVGVPVMGAESLEKQMVMAIVVGGVRLDSLLSELELRGYRVIESSTRGFGESLTVKLLMEVPADKVSELHEDLTSIAERYGALAVSEV